MSTAPRPDDLLDVMRTLLVEDPAQNALVVLGTQEEVVFVPCDYLPPRQILGLLVAAMGQGTVPNANWAAMVSDTYIINVPLAERDQVPDSLEEAFAAGDPRVSEAVMAVCVSPDGPSYCVQQPYAKDGDEYEWGRVRNIPVDEMTGPIASRLRELVAL